jgi:hypothetical protein
MRAAILLLPLLACVQTTGGAIVDFPVAAAGRSDLTEGAPFEFTSDVGGWHVVLTKATLHVGAIYLDQAEPVSGAGATPCILPGTYVAQMTTGMDVDLLSPRPQRFPALGHGTTGQALVGQMWLTGGNDVNATDDPTKILVVAGTADKAGDVRPFSGTITIGSNRQLGTSGAAGASPICKERIVTVDALVPVAASGGLLVRIDVQKLFTNVDWSSLAKLSNAYAFQDAPNEDQPSTNLYGNLHAGSASGSPYTFTWTGAL